MASFRPRLVSEVTDFDALAPLRRGKLPKAELTVAAVGGPKIRVQSGLRMTLTGTDNKLLTSSKAAVLCLLEKLPYHLSPLVAYRNQPIVEEECLFSASRQLVWVYVREGRDGPWPDAATFINYLKDREEAYAELVGALRRHVSLIKFHPKLLVDEDEHLPSWFAEWRSKHPSIRLEKLPSFSKFFQT